TLHGPGAARLHISAPQEENAWEIVVEGRETVRFTDLTFNSSIVNGGGILTLINSVVSGNTVKGLGGDGAGIHNAYGGILTLDHSTVSGNTAIYDGNGGLGGGIYNEGTLILTDSTVSGNRVLDAQGGFSGEGGGIYNEEAT